VPESVRAEVLARQKDIAAGTVKPFTGPIVDNEGRPVAAPGTALTDEQILAMNFLVSGVQGKVGK
jgi:basic membrane protein A